VSTWIYSIHYCVVLKKKERKEWDKERPCLASYRSLTDANEVRIDNVAIVEEGSVQRPVQCELLARAWTTDRARTNVWRGMGPGRRQARCQKDRTKPSKIMCQYGLLYIVVE
jgi:hypothetical protein